MDEPTRERMLQALTLLMKDEDAVAFFNDPVDPIAMGIPTYFDIITKPMDLGRVKAKLTRRKYASADEALADIKRVWSNCKKFNPKDEPVVASCAALEEKWKKLYKDIVQGGGGKKPAPKAPERPAPAGKKPLPKPLGPSGGGKGGGEKLTSPTGGRGGKPPPPAPPPDAKKAKGKAAAAPPPPKPELTPGGGPPVPGGGGGLGRPCSKIKPGGHPMKRVLRVVEELMKITPEADPFLAPVPVDEVPDYLGIVKHPMDLGTVKSRLRQMEKSGWQPVGDAKYEGPKAVLKDLALVWNNCRVYNDPGALISEHAGVLEEECRRMWDALGLPGPGEGGGGKGDAARPGGKEAKGGGGDRKRKHDAAVVIIDDDAEEARPPKKGKAGSRPADVVVLEDDEDAPRKKPSSKPGGGGGGMKVKIKVPERGGAGGGSTRCEPCRTAKRGGCGTPGAHLTCLRRGEGEAAAAAATTPAPAPPPSAKRRRDADGSEGFGGGGSDAGGGGGSSSAQEQQHRSARQAQKAAEAEAAAAAEAAEAAAAPSKVRMTNGQISKLEKRRQKAVEQIALAEELAQNLEDMEEVAARLAEEERVEAEAEAVALAERERLLPAMRPAPPGYRPPRGYPLPDAVQRLGERVLCGAAAPSARGWGGIGGGPSARAGEEGGAEEGKEKGAGAGPGPATAAPGRGRAAAGAAAGARRGRVGPLDVRALVSWLVGTRGVGGVAGAASKAAPTPGLGARAGWGWDPFTSMWRKDPPVAVAPEIPPAGGDMP